MSSTPEAEEVVFGRVASWLFGNILDKKSRRDAMAWRFAHDLSRATYCRRLRNSGRKCPVQLVADDSGTWTHADAHLVVWELMQVFYMFQTFADDFRVFDPPKDGKLSRSRPLAFSPGSYVVLPYRLSLNRPDEYGQFVTTVETPTPINFGAGTVYSRSR